MRYDEADLSTRQREMLKREQRILAAAESILITEGFLDMSMARVAQKSRCPRATIYLHFVSREDIVVALACKAWEIRQDLIERGAAYPGPTRIRMAAMAEGFALFFALYPDYFSILHKATATICEKASPYRVERLRAAEQATANVLQHIISEAVRLGELETTRADVNGILFAYSAMATGGFALHEVGFPEATLRVPHAMGLFRGALNALGDVYGWRPLTHEVDWYRTAAEIRRAVFPEESERVYGPGQWHSEWVGQAQERQEPASSPANAGQIPGRQHRADVSAANSKPHRAAIRKGLEK
jgi:AcrR family transcriptional regulator